MNKFKYWLVKKLIGKTPFANELDKRMREYKLADVAADVMADKYARHWLQVKVAQEEIQRQDARIAELESNLRVYLDDAAIGPEHISVNWTDVFTELLSNTKEQTNDG